MVLLPTTYLKLITIFVSLISSNIYAHGGISIPACIMGGDYFVNSKYICKITFREASEKGSYYGEKKEFDLAEIISGKNDQWKSDSGLLARYTTAAKGSEIIVIAAVSCPLEGQNPDPNVINIQVSVKDSESFRDVLSLYDASILPGRELRATFSFEDNLAEVSCTVR